MLELPPHLEAALATGHTVVVPTPQRASAVRLGYAARRLRDGHRAFRTPDVQSLNGWLRGQRTLLRRPGTSEEWLLWRAAVTQAAAHLAVPAGPGLVDAVRRSAAVLFEWQIPPAALRQAGTAESLLLADTLAALEARRVQLGLAASWQEISELASRPPPRAPVFAGFTHHPPARQALFDAWAARGISVVQAAPHAAAAAASVAQPADPAAELDLVAQWCRARLRRAPGARLLVIVPDLAGREEEVRRVFDEALEAAYAIEGGRPLAGYEPVAAALRTLQLLTGEVDLAQVSRWLRAGAWEQPEAGRRAMLEVWLRGVVPPRLDAGQLLRALRAAPPSLLAPADRVAATLEQLRAALSGPAPASLSTWSARFAGVLRIGGLHPQAARRRGSHEQQVLQRLEELLQECAAVPATLGAHSAAEAVALLAQLLARTQFEPATGDAPVTLTASLADPVVRYDGIWASGLHAGVIPGPARFDPFIPVALQRQAGIIGADPARRVEAAQLDLQRLGAASHELVLSAPRHAEDLELGAAALVQPYAARTYAPVRDSPGAAQGIRTARRMERYQDELGASWPLAVPLPAGSRAIELQSRCPFRAYAQLRLGAEPLEVPLPGITPRERGQLLHRALELLWERLGGAAGLGAACAQQMLPGMIDACVEQAAAQILRDTDPTADATGLLALRRAAIARERGRAARVITALCAVEAGRAPFVVAELEGAHRVQVAGALIDVRIDRMDRLEDGTHAILDYKSGRAAAADWQVARTTHPQLLVYLLAAGVPVSTLAVAHLDPRAVSFKGVSDAPGRLPGVHGADSWEQQVHGWREQVAQLAAAFVRGDARVAPAQGACDHCHLHAFCRIAQLGGDAGATADEDEDEDEDEATDTMALP